MEYAVTAGYTWTVADKKLLERVQERAIKMVLGLSATSYTARLIKLGILTLEDRRSVLDLIQSFKIVHGLDNVSMDTWFQLIGGAAQRVTRYTQDPLNLTRKYARSDTKKSF